MGEERVENRNGTNVGHGVDERSQGAEGSCRRRIGGCEESQGGGFEACSLDAEGCVWREGKGYG